MCLYLATAGDDTPAPLPEIAASRQPFTVARLALLGIRGPVRPSIGALRGLSDADDTLFAVLIPTGSAGQDAHRADALCALINDALGLAPRAVGAAEAA